MSTTRLQERASHFIRHQFTLDRIWFAIEEIPSSALEALIRYDWPGNIRELQNVIERSVILSQGPELRIAMPEFNSQLAPVVLVGRASNGSEEAERARILQALKEAKGQIGGPDGAAARMGLRRTTLQSRMKKYKIARQYQ
jgi:formate hydrogenlyase transcriptional activator